MKKQSLQSYLDSESYQEDLRNMKRAQHEEPCGRCNNVGHAVCRKNPCPEWKYETSHTHICPCTPGGGLILIKKMRLKKEDEQGESYANGY